MHVSPSGVCAHGCGGEQALKLNVDVWSVQMDAGRWTRMVIKEAPKGRRRRRRSASTGGGIDSSEAESRALCSAPLAFREADQNPAGTFGSGIFWIPLISPSSRLQIKGQLALMVTSPGAGF